MPSVKLLAVDSVLVDELNESPVRTPEQQMLECDEFLEAVAQLRGSLSLEKIAGIISHETGIPYDECLEYVRGH